MDTEISACLTNKWRARINQDRLYNKKRSAPRKRLGKMVKNQSLPVRLLEKNSQGEHDLTMHEHHEKPTVWWLRPSLSNPRSINDIVWAFLRANPTLLRFVTNRVLTYIYKDQIIFKFPRALPNTLPHHSFSLISLSLWLTHSFPFFSFLFFFHFLSYTHLYHSHPLH